MKNVKNSILTLIVLGLIVVASGFDNPKKVDTKNESIAEKKIKKHQNVNMFVTHGHCSTPFMGRVENFKIDLSNNEEQGNPLENMQIAFEINPNTFNVCSAIELTEQVKTPGLFISQTNENISFKSTHIYTMGLDWYQINGKMSIKGIEKEVKLFVSGIRNPKENMATALVIEGKMDLSDWGIDYDLLVNGKSNSNPTKWMHLNMQVELSDLIGC